ncbi:MAG: ABC transporter substrate-binding protein [Candidatus Competibacterales bacterium]
MIHVVRAPALGAVLGLATVAALAADDTPDPRDWPAVEAAARDQRVHWYAWGGEPRVNDYIDWVGEQVQTRFGVELVHVKLDDTAAAVSRVLAEKAAGQGRAGSVDLIWINGENFAAMKDNDLLFGPWAEDLPHWQYVDVAGKPTVQLDFTVPTDGLESPWGMAQLVFLYDRQYVAEPPTNLGDLKAWAAANPGRFTYPEPPDFLGSTFLKQALYGLLDDPSRLTAPVDQATFATLTEPLWAYLDDLHPHLWRRGLAFPQNSSNLRLLLGDGEIDIAMTFNPAEASAAIESGELPPSVRTYILDGGTIGNTHFVAIPFNAAAKAGALVVANFLLSPEAQAHKQDPAVWGDFTVLDVAELPPKAKERFAALELGVATLSPTELGQSLPEPHPSWMVLAEEAWRQRYAAGR